nr:MAG TPA: hypothetical protein [Caudoviricetes sp.]
MVFNPLQIYQIKAIWNNPPRLSSHKGKRKRAPLRASFPHCGQPPIQAN